MTAVVAAGATADLALEVVFADSAMVVLNKPSGLLAVPGRGADKQDCLLARVVGRYPDALTVHRLDMATSGLLVVARGALMQKQLNQAFANRAVEKLYVAVVGGHVVMQPGLDWRLIDLPVGADWPNRPRQQIDAVHGRSSQTRYRVLGYDAGLGVTRLELAPVTGRTHQLRVHLQAIGHAICGDQLYAPPDVLAKSTRLLLHASGLSLLHPGTGEKLHWQSAPPF